MATTTEAIRSGDTVMRRRASSPRLAKQTGRVVKVWDGQYGFAGKTFAKVRFDATWRRMSGEPGGALLTIETKNLVKTEAGG